MRRIRTGKITPDTLIYTDSSELPERASAIEDIAIFFVRPETEAANQKAAGRSAGDSHTQLSIRKLLHDSWQITMQHNSMTVYAGGLVLVNLLLAAGLIGSLGLVTGGLLSWAICITCHNFYLIFMLRLYRGQAISSDFINRQFGPVIPTFLLACTILALMMGGGLLLFVIPCLIVSIYYIFVPFLIVDHKYKLVEAMHASRLLLQKRNQQYVRLITILILMHYICLLLIIPIPLTLPIFASAISDLYEKITNS
jgi:hypothetical protein